MFERVHGPEHYEIAVNLNNLAALCYAQGRYNEAEPLYLRALAIKEKILSPEHPDVAMTLNNLAALYRNAGRTGEARAAYQRALAIFIRTLGEVHPKTKLCRENYCQLPNTTQTEHIGDPHKLTPLKSLTDTTPIAIADNGRIGTIGRR